MHFCNQPADFVEWGEYASRDRGVKRRSLRRRHFHTLCRNGSLVPPKVTLEQAFERKRPTILIFYVDDNSDSKQYSTVVSQLQAFYGRATDIIALRVDAILPKKTYAKTEAGYYYSGVVSQTVLFDETGKVVLNQKGSIPYEQLDDVLRKVFKLVPRSESMELKRQPVNEFNTELIR